MADRLRTCPRCGYQRRSDAARVFHGWCPMAPDAGPVEMTVGGGRTYSIYCGNFDCPTRIAGRTFTLTIDEIPDGQIWLCPDCRPSIVDVETALL
jgi:hypothetical protein